MIYPVGTSKVLRGAQYIQSIQFSPNGIYVVFLSRDALNIFLSHPTAKLSACTRSPKSLKELGASEEALWNDDSDKIAVSTASGCCILFSLKRVSEPEMQAYPTPSSLQRDLFPEFALVQVAIVSVGAKIESFCSISDKFCVCNSNGILMQFYWADGFAVKNNSRKLSGIPFAFDLNPSRASKIVEGTKLRSMCNAVNSMSGILAVLSDGKAAILVSEANSFDFNHVQGVFAPHLNNAVTVCHNAKLRQMVVSTNSGFIQIYVVNELSKELLLISKYDLKHQLLSRSVQHFATKLSVTSDGLALCAMLSNKTIHMYSIFGSLLWESSSWNFKGVSCAAIHPRGDQLCCSCSLLNTKEDSADHNSITIVQSLLRNSPSICSSPSLSGFILLHGQDRALLSSNKDFESSNVVKHWKQVKLPPSYLNGTSAIKYSCVDESGNNLALAAEYGVVLYDFEHLRWKLFGNECQEKEISVCGGMAWFEEFIVFTCRNNDAFRYEIRAYSKMRNLDNSFKNSVQLSCEPVVVNLYKNFFTILDRQSNLLLFKISKSQKDCCDLMKVQETPLNMFVPYPHSILSIMFTDVGHQIGNCAVMEKTPRSFLINVAGRVAIFPRDPMISELEIAEQVPLCTPSVIANNVEFMSLYSPVKNSLCNSEYFKDSVWLMCGASGLKAWISLPFDSTSDVTSFNVKRAVFVFHPINYPLAFECNSGFLMGVDTENVTASCIAALNPPPKKLPPSANSNSRHSRGSDQIPHYVLSKTLEIFVPQLIEEMLRRNLSGHSIRLMHSLTSLQSFDHMLELLLHNVLEAEATTSDPIADPLLPCIINLLRNQYPNKFLNILARCARKTEVAMWTFLFNAAGNPADYFKSCIEANELATAASYLIILQNLEPLSVSKQYANILVDTCLEKREWMLVRDIIRFLKSIASSAGDEISPKVAMTPYSIYSFTTGGSMVSSGSSSAAYTSPTSKGGAPNSASRTRTFSQSAGNNNANSAQTTASVVATSTAVAPLTFGGPSTYTGQKPSVTRLSLSNYYNSRRFRSSFSLESDLNSQQPNRKDSAASGTGMTSSADSAYGSGVNKAVSTSPGTTWNPSMGQQPDSTDIFYLSSLIARRARGLLMNNEIHELFLMASHIGFNVTSWLKRERHRAARVDNYETALEKLHEDFDWPFPVLAKQSMEEKIACSTLSGSSPASSVVTLQDFPPTPLKSSSGGKMNPTGVNTHGTANHSSNSSTCSNTATAEPIPVPKSAHVSSLPPDSRQPSLYSSLKAASSSESLAQDAVVPNAGELPVGINFGLENLSLEAITSGLTPNQNAMQHARLQLADLSSSCEGYQSNLATPQDDTSSWSDDVTNGGGPHLAGSHNLETSLLLMGSVAETAQSQLSQCADLETLVQQFKNRGSERSKRLLKYVLEVMVESECYEWAVLLCLMLSDVTQAISIINNIIGSASLTDVGQRLISGLASLDSWSARNCVTYRLFLAALFPYVQVLKTVMDFSFKTQKGKTTTKNGSSSKTKDKQTPAVGLLMPAKNLQSDKSASSVNNTQSAANRRLSWWRGSVAASQNERSEVADDDNAASETNDAKELAQLQEETIEWLTDSLQTYRQNEQLVALGRNSDNSDSITGQGNGNLNSSSFSDNYTNDAQRCVIS